MEIQFSQLQNKKIADFLIITATDIETQAVIKRFQPVCVDGLLHINKNDRQYTAGVFGEYNVIHCQCKNMGTQEVGSSMITTTNALEDWPCIKGVLMVGIAFGMYNDETDQYKQNYSDVLIAEKIFPYENQRLNKDGSSKYRGKEHFPNRNFLDAFSVISRDWNGTNLEGISTKVSIVPLLTGEKLVDNLAWRNELKQKYENYKGGEMEGMGIASACENKNVPWILLKSICDFGDGNKGDTLDAEELKNARQINAADAASKACELALKTPNVKEIVPNKINYSYRHDIANIEDVFFLAYSQKCRDYYLHRTIDTETSGYILTKSVWVSGKTGIGKSDLLRHTLIENNIKYIYIDLSLCDSVEEMVFQIYETTCDYFGEEVHSGNLKTTISSLAKLLDSKCTDNVSYIMVEEIPFEENSENFHEFVRRLSQMIVYISTHAHNKVRFILSSIAMPKEALDTYRDKIESLIHFVQLDDWKESECIDLIDLLCNAVGLLWESEELKFSFAKQMEYSPRRIKASLKTCCSLDYRVISSNIVDKLVLR